MRKDVILLRSLALLMLFAVAGCTGNGDLFTPRPSGTIVLSMVGGNGQPISSSVTNPVIVHDAFALNVSESGYKGNFTATVVSYTAPATAPCYAPSGPNNTVLSFTPQSSPPISGVGPSPCGPGNGDIEGIRVMDNNGASNTQYFENQ